MPKHALFIGLGEPDGEGGYIFSEEPKVVTILVDKELSPEEALTILVDAIDKLTYAKT